MSLGALGVECAGESSEGGDIGISCVVSYHTYIYLRKVCVFVCHSPLGAVGPKTGAKAQKRAKGHKTGPKAKKLCEGPVWGFLAPTQIEMMRAIGWHQSSLSYSGGTGFNDGSVV